MKVQGLTIRDELMLLDQQVEPCRTPKRGKTRLGESICVDCGTPWQKHQ